MRDGGCRPVDNNGSMKSSWWLNEADFAGPEHLDPDYVTGYERKAGDDSTSDVDALVERGLGKTSTVLDLAAGTGVFTRAVAPLCASVTAIDVSPAMTDAIMQQVTAAGLDNVSVANAGFLSYEPATTFDFIFSRNALHQLPDLWKPVALTRIASWLAPGGIVRLLDLVFDFEPSEFEVRMDAWMRDAWHDPMTGYTAPEFAAHVQTEFSTYSWLFEPMLEHCGFEILDRQSVRSIYASYTCRLAAERA